MSTTGTPCASSRRRTRRSRVTSPGLGAGGRILSCRRPVSTPAVSRSESAGALEKAGESGRLTGAVKAWATARSVASPRAAHNRAGLRLAVRPTPLRQRARASCALLDRDGKGRHPGGGAKENNPAQDQEHFLLAQRAKLRGHAREEKRDGEEDD